MRAHFITVRLRNGRTIVVNTVHITHVTVDDRQVATLWLSDGNHYETEASLSEIAKQITAQDGQAQP
jgi:hypothetical protein